jgi:hypothetical protein
MLLKNKKTGEIREYGSVGATTFGKEGVLEAFAVYDSLAELNEEWEDYEESEEYWIVTDCGGVSRANANPYMFKEIGNYFLSREEAEKAVEKLKAITRLKKCGFKFEGYADRDRANGGDIVIYAHVDIPNNNLLEEAQPDMLKDLDLIFGGEE